MSFFKDKRVLVTGAGGTIGSQLCLKLQEENPARVIMFDSSELALYNIDRIMGQPHFVPVLGDVSNFNDVDRLFHRYNFDFIFHAAAYKHVRMCEENPGPAWRVNSEGTLNIVSRAGTARFVLVSTDKAVNPTSLMGQTKRRAEEHTRRYHQTVVRLGNVYGSSGSVVPLWKEQIARGEPVTITHPQATRYFATIDYAAAKILMAAHPRAEVGTLVLEMGRPRALVDVARELGATEFKYIGMRTGEKLHEELFVGQRKQSEIGGLALDEAA